jgi:hypothetical protein
MVMCFLLSPNLRLSVALEISEVPHNTVGFSDTCVTRVQRTGFSEPAVPAFTVVHRTVMLGGWD